MVLFLLTIVVFLASFFIRRIEIQWLGMFVSVCSVAITLTDYSLSDNEVVILVVLCFFIMLLMAKNVYFNKSG